MKSKFLFMQIVKSQKGKMYAIGHLVDDLGHFNLEVTWIEVDQKTSEKLQSLSVYPVSCTGIRNNKFPVWSFG